MFIACPHTGVPEIGQSINTQPDYRSTYYKRGNLVFRMPLKRYVPFPVQASTALQLVQSKGFKTSSQIKSNS
jgi:hypothetical protein